MHEKEIRELFELSMRVIQETEAYVNFGVSSYGTLCIVTINDTGFDMDRGNSTYFISCGISEEEEKKEIQKAKEHLGSLLLKGRCPQEGNH